MSAENKRGYSRRLRISLIILVALLAALVSVGLAYSHSQNADSKGITTWQAAVGLATKDQAIQGMVFLPEMLWINKGDTVNWTIQSGDIHTVTFLPPKQSPPQYTASPNQV